MERKPQAIRRSTAGLAVFLAARRARLRARQAMAQAREDVRIRTPHDALTVLVCIGASVLTAAIWLHNLGVF